MRNRLPLLLVACVVGLVATNPTNPTNAFAEPPPPPPPAAPSLAKPGAFKVPGDLGGKRGGSFNQALTKAGLQALAIPPPPAYARLTPANPVAASAKITKVGKSTYVGPTSERPDGLLILEAPVPRPPGPSMFPQNPFQPAIAVPVGTLAIEFSAEGNKTYFVDCRVAPAQFVPQLPGTASASKPITFSRSGSTVTQQVTADEGHYIYPLRTNAGLMITQTVELKFDQESYFYGCEMTKVEAASK